MFDAARTLAESARAAASWSGKAATLEWLATRVRASRVPSGVVLTSAPAARSASGMLKYSLAWRMLSSMGFSSLPE